MRTNEAIAHFGGVTKLANALGIGRAAVYQWGEFPPVDRQCHIEVVSGGALKADLGLTNQAANSDAQSEDSEQSGAAA